MKKQLAEFIGTFTLVLFGCGAAVLAGGTALAQLWLFIIAPVIGAVAAGLLFRSGQLDAQS